MNTKPHVVPTRILVAFVALVVSLPFIATADDAATQQQNAAYQKAIQQENLAKDMASIQAELASMHDEMKALLPADLEMIDRAFKQINSLSVNEMKATVESLRAAAKSGDVKSQLEQLANAYNNQTSAVIKIKDISGELSARGIRDDITDKLTDLLKRQAADMDEVARLGQMSQAPGGLRDSFQQRYQVVLGDQVSLSDDVKTTIQSINDAATNLPEDARKFMVAAAGIATQQRLAENAAGAVSLTQSGPFAQAVATQESVVDSIAMVIHSLSSDEKVLQQLQELSTTLGQLIDLQKGVSTAMEEQRRGNIGYDLQKRQMDISDQAEAARAELTPLNSQAAGLVQDGHVSMEKVVSITSVPGNRREERNAIAPAQQTAINDLDAAKKQIDQQIAMLNASKAPTAADELADLDSLLREVQQAALDEAHTAQAAQTPNSPFMPTAAAQKTFHDHVDNLQQRALPVSPDAAAAIGEASQQLTTAASAAQQPVMAAAHVGAAQDLEKAYEILAKQLNALADDTKAEQALADAIKKVEDAQKQTDEAKNDVNADTQAAANQLSTAQQDVATAQQDATAAQQDAAAATPAAATPAAGTPAANAQAALAQANAAAAAGQAAAAAGQAPAAAANADAAANAEAQALAALQAQAAAAEAAADAAAAGDADAAADAGAGEGEGEGKGEGAGEGAGAGAGEGEGEGEGEGAGAGSGAGVGNGPGAPVTPGDAPGQQMNSAATGEGGQGQANTSLAMKGGGAGGGAPGALGNFGGTGGWNGPVQVVSGLSPHDRAAVAQLQTEKPPREFVPQVQQYYKNLADGSGL